MPTSGSGRVQVVGRGNEKAPRPIQEKKKKKSKVPLKSVSQD